MFLYYTCSLCFYLMLYYFQKMSLYNHCLISVVLNDDYKTDDLPHTIQDDVTVLQSFKNKLHEWNATFEMSNQIQQRMDIFCYYHNFMHDYEVRPGCELEVRRLIKEEEDLREELDRLRNEIICIKDKIPTQLKVVAQKIVNKMDDQWLCFLSINLQ